MQPLVHLSAEEKEAVLRLYRAVDQFERGGGDPPKMTLKRFKIFLWIAYNQALSQPQLGEDLGLNVRQRSIDPALLAEGGVVGGAEYEGLRIVSIEEDPEDPRRNVILLNEKGHRIVRAMARILSSGA